MSQLQQLGPGRFLPPSFAPLSSNSVGYLSQRPRSSGLQEGESGPPQPRRFWIRLKKPRWRRGPERS